ncbi:histone-lysine N-methyltransferase 2B-like isoform X2 [Neocloeon triangulifer]|uniref:histone-lysine N-methyltransferase 2B-like isoform X2 n=1 Tax=Neocloeon triangulifer TaxID=2078957 RepID=UPI00286F8BB3|nr:histone-lysine N-methyltransferase 2B-like isoform X2 [Neocloeon triangulifer]
MSRPQPPAINKRKRKSGKTAPAAAGANALLVIRNPLGSFLRFPEPYARYFDSIWKLGLNSNSRRDNNFVSINEYRDMQVSVVTGMLAQLFGSNVGVYSRSAMDEQVATIRIPGVKIFAIFALGMLKVVRLTADRLEKDSARFLDTVNKAIRMRENVPSETFSEFQEMAATAAGDQRRLEEEFRKRIAFREQDTSITLIETVNLMLPSQDDPFVRDDPSPEPICPQPSPGPTPPNPIHRPTPRPTPEPSPRPISPRPSPQKRRPKILPPVFKERDARRAKLDARQEFELFQSAFATMRRSRRCRRPKKVNPLLLPFDNPDKPKQTRRAKKKARADFVQAIRNRPAPVIVERPELRVRTPQQTRRSKQRKSRGRRPPLPTPAPVQQPGPNSQVPDIPDPIEDQPVLPGPEPPSPGPHDDLPPSPEPEPLPEPEPDPPSPPSPPSPFNEAIIRGLQFTPMSKHSIMYKLSQLHASAGAENNEHPITFKHLAPVDSMSRKVAALAFAQLLEMSKMDYIKLNQPRAYGDIKITLTPSFDHDIERPEFDNVVQPNE